MYIQRVWYIPYQAETCMYDMSKSEFKNSKNVMDMDTMWVDTCVMDTRQRINFIGCLVSITQVLKDT
jgi:hypothetical protein